MNSKEWARKQASYYRRSLRMTDQEQLIADLAATEKERDRYKEMMESCGRRLFDAADKIELCEILHKSETARANAAESRLRELRNGAVEKVASMILAHRTCSCNYEDIAMRIVDAILGEEK